MPDSTPPATALIHPIEPDHRPLSAAQLRTAKRAYSTRNIDIGRGHSLDYGDSRPSSGDLLLAEVVRIGQHPRLELATGRRARLHTGDQVLVCYADRYAPDQFEARVPADLANCDLVAAGGIASEMRARHRRMKQPTRLRPLGLVLDVEGQRLNLRDRALPKRSAPNDLPLTVAVAGSSMNAGKTTAAAHLIKGIERSGLSVAAAKVTGTGAGGDYWFMVDSGAHPVLDFTHAGYASTFGLLPAELEEIAETLVAELARYHPDVIVLEIADGIFQEETAALLTSGRFRSLINGILFASGDASGALAGKLWMAQHNLPLIGITGALTASPLAVREAMRAASLPVYDMDQLSDAGIAQLLLPESEGRAHKAQA